MPRKLKGKYYDLNCPFKDNLGNRYSASAAERLVLWLQMTTGTPTDNASYNLTSIYLNSPTAGQLQSLDPPGGALRFTFTSNDSSNQHVSVTPPSSGILSHVSLADEATTAAGSDTAFSISLWINFTNVASSGLSYLFGKGTSSVTEYYAYLDADYDQLVFAINDQDNSKTQSIRSTSDIPTSDLNGVWNHLVFTYDGSGGNTAYAGMKIYLNGEIHTTSNYSSDSGYLSMKRDDDDTLKVGASYQSDTEPDAQISEFAMWSGYALSAADVKAIYNITKLDNGTVSGIISNPTRIMLQDQDNHTGSYPTLARTGDPDFLGTYPSRFDDTNTIVFSTDSNIIYPTGLPESGPGSKFISGGVATPNALQGLKTVGSCSAGIADTHISFTPGESITPFNESRVTLDNETAFYTTGTASGTLPGFAQRLSSKTILTIDINPTETTRVALSTGTLPNAEGLAEGVNSGLAYFNFQQKKWEIVGDLTTGSNVDYLNKDQAVVTGSMLSIIPAEYIGTNLATWDMQPFNGGLGGPTDVAGFPYATKFNATSSQLYNTTASITAPFLLEKVEMRFSGVIGTYPVLAASEQMQITTFMLVLQREQPVTASVETFFETYRYNVDKLEVTGTTFDSNTDKSIIWYGRIGTYFTHSFATEAALSSSFPGTWSAADLWLPQGGAYPTGSFVLRGTPNIPCKQPRVGAAFFGRGYGAGTPGTLFGRQKGGRDLRDRADGRSFIRSVIGSQVVSSSVSFMALAAGGYIPFDAYLHESRESPFVLLPGDKLVLMHSHQGAVGDPASANAPSEVNIAKEYVNNLEPGGGTLTLFGSLLQDNLPVEQKSNQPLTSDAIHEDLHYDNPVYDQWDVEPEQALTGSYVDLIITGTMFATGADGSYGNPAVDNVRGVVASVARGQAGTTGSLQRFVRLTDSIGTVYDSYPPNALEVIKASGKGLFGTALSNAAIAVGAPTGSYYIHALGGQDLSGSDTQWYMRPAYEIKHQRFLAQSFRGTRLSVFDGDNELEGAGEVKQLDTAYIFGSGSAYGIATVSSDERGNYIDSPGARKNTTRWLWGFGDGAYNLPTPDLKVSAFGFFISTPIMRGYKYGLGGIFGSRVDSRWRRDRFGQFRDMLEQRKYPVTLDSKGGLSYPVEIIFVPQDSQSGETTDPAKTHSQNLDTYATSTMPYYDGQVKDRLDNPDIVLEPIEVNIDVS